MEDRNGGAIMAIGGVLTVVILGSWALKIIRGLLLQLGKTFDAFGTMMTSFVGSLWAVAQVAFLVSLIAASVIAAVYFTYKYILMVKRATEIQKDVALQLQSHSYGLDEKLREFEVDVEGRLRSMSRILGDALKEPKITPASATASPQPVLLPETETCEARDVTDVATSPNPSIEGGPCADISAVSPSL